MDSYIAIAVILLVLQAIIAIVFFGRLEAAFSRWRWRRQHQYMKPWKIGEETPREIMKKRSIPPLDMSSLRALRIDDGGQLTESPSLLYSIADSYEREVNKSLFKLTKGKSAETTSELDITAMLQSDPNRKKLLAEMERHANKLRRRYELETYNARRSNFKRFATDRMIGLGRHRFAADNAAAGTDSKMSI